MDTSRPSPKWWLELTAGYLRSLGRRGRRPNTLRAYDYELRDFGEWLDRNRVNVLTELTRRHVENWQDEIAERLAPRTCQVAATAVRGALRWAEDQDSPFSSRGLWLRVIQRRVPHLRPRPIPIRNLDLICKRLDFVSTESNLIELRTRALFWVLFSSGARISEALSLNRVSVADGTALVIQKGGSEHRLMINSKAGQAIKAYLELRTDPAIPMFVSYCQRPFSRLGWQEAQRAWNRLAGELNIDRFTSHEIRHSCATELLRRGINPLVIAKHLGHHGLGSIEGYAEVGLDSRRQAMLALDAQ